MELTIIRRYCQKGTNGTLIHGDEVICYTIELPWRNNQRKVSCIPEGRYPLCRRYSAKYGWHYEVGMVENRQLILIHAANNAQKELQGCIAPVSKLTGEGMGVESRIAVAKLKRYVDPLLLAGKSVYITIKSLNHEKNNSENSRTYTQIL